VSNIFEYLLILNIKVNRVAGFIKFFS